MDVLDRILGVLDRKLHGAGSQQMHGLHMHGDRLAVVHAGADQAVGDIAQAFGGAIQRRVAERAGKRNDLIRVAQDRQHLVVGECFTGGAGEEREPVVSPDGRRIAYSSGIDDSDLMELTLDGSKVSPLLATSRRKTRSICGARRSPTTSSITPKPASFQKTDRFTPFASIRWLPVHPAPGHNSLIFQQVN